MSKIIYMAHPFGGEKDALDRAREWYRWIYRTQPGVVPVADWILTIEVLDDRDPEDRKLGMWANFELIRRCDEIWSVGSGASKGRDDEVRFALEEVGIPHLDLTYLGVDAPDGAVVPPALIMPAKGRPYGCKRN